MLIYVLSMVGGILGALTRFGLSTWIQKKRGLNQFPIAVLLINMLGSFLLGLFIAMLEGNQDFTLMSTYAFFGVGYCGALTTFSTFSVEAVQFFQQGNFKSFLMYILLSMTTAIFSFALGYIL